MTKGMTYKDSGVDFDSEGQGISALVKGIRTFHTSIRKGFGAPYTMDGQFAGLIDFGDYTLSLCTDGVGSKIMIAEAIKKYDTVGIDCIAMNVNDMICIGAEPLAFVDYLAMEKVDDTITEQIGQGLGKGAELSNIEIIGGETATLPEVVNGLDLAGTALGYVKKENIISGSAIESGDAIIGLASSGLHSNGYTLARKIVEASGLDYNDELPDGLSSHYSASSLGELLLTPTRIYVRGIMALLKEYQHAIHGMANMTGGGLRNLNRLKNGVTYTLDNIPEPEYIFSWLGEKGGVSTKELYQTFNMGLGYTIIAQHEYANSIIEYMNGLGYPAMWVGRVEKNYRKESRVVVPSLDLEYSGYL